MKKLLICLLFTGSLTAVAKARNGAILNIHYMQQVKDYLIMKGGKMHLAKGGNITSLENELTLPNGTTISINGIVKSSEGTTLQLKEGEKIDMDGKIMVKTSNSKKDSI